MKTYKFYYIKDNKAVEYRCNAFSEKYAIRIFKDNVPKTKYLMLDTE